MGRKRTQDPTKGKGRGTSFRASKEIDIPEEALQKEQEVLQELAKFSKVTEALLDRLFTSTVRDLIAKIEAGIATPTDKANAIRILQANNITMDLEDEESRKELDELAGMVLPDVGDMEFDMKYQN
jgi:hypothetical protein